MKQFIFTLLVYTFLNNIILTTGFGFSVMMRTARTRGNILPFSILLCIFAVLTMAICYPIDHFVSRDLLSIRWLRPLAVIIVTALLYFGVRFFLGKFMPAISERVTRILPATAFNNLVIGICIMVYMHYSLTFPIAIATAIGSSLGFLLLSWLTAEGMERLDNPDVPKAFRGLPSAFIYLGLLALATMGWQL